MEQVRVERLDHLGLIASVIKDLGLIAMIDRRLVPDEQEVITPTASFNSLGNVLVRKSAVTARSWLT